MRVAALSAALVAALLLPGGPPGVGVLVVALAIAVAAARGRGRSLDLWLFGAPAVALAGVAALLDARWLVSIDLLAACLLATLAVAGPRLAAPVATVEALRSVPAVTPRPDGRCVPALRGAALAGVVVLPFGAILLSADAAFAALAGDVPLPSVGLLPVRALTFAVVFAGSVALALTRGASPRQLSLGTGRVLRPIEWIPPLAALVLLFAGFIAVQVTVLFAGRSHVLRTTDLTYAEYARSGYWQLLGAAILTLAVVGAALRLADTPTRRHAIALKALLASTCALTIVLLASALYRLDLYENEFGLTRLRLAAEAFAWGVAGLFLLILAAGALAAVASNFARIALAAAAVALLGFSFANPDELIARHNIDRFRETGRLDVAYLQTLSADAAPSIAELPPRLRGQALAPLATRLETRDGVGSVNLSRRRARRLLATVAP